MGEPEPVERASGANDAQQLVRVAPEVFHVAAAAVLLEQQPGSGRGGPGARRVAEPCRQPRHGGLGICDEEVRLADALPPDSADGDGHALRIEVVGEYPADLAGLEAASEGEPDGRGGMPGSRCGERPRGLEARRGDRALLPGRPGNVERDLGERVGGAQPFGERMSARGGADGLEPVAANARYAAGFGRLERLRGRGGAYRVDGAARYRPEGPAFLSIVRDGLPGGPLGRQDLEVAVQRLGERARLRPRQGRERRRARPVRAFRPEPPSQPLARRVDDVNLPHAASELPDRSYP